MIKFRLDYERIALDLTKFDKYVSKYFGNCLITEEVSPEGKKHFHALLDTSFTIKQLRDNLKNLVGKTKQQKWYSFSQTKDKNPEEFLCYICKGEELDKYNIYHNTLKTEDEIDHYNTEYWEQHEKISKLQETKRKSKTLPLVAQIVHYIDASTEYDVTNNDDILDAVVDYIYGIKQKGTQPMTLMGTYYGVKYNYKPHKVRNRFRLMRRKFDPDPE